MTIPAQWTVTAAGPLAATVVVQAGSPAGTLSGGGAAFPGDYAVPGAVWPGGAWPAQPLAVSSAPSGFCPAMWTVTPAGPLAATVVVTILDQGGSELSPPGPQTAYPQPAAAFGPSA